MKEKAGYRDNLEYISSKFPDQTVLTINDVAKLLRCDPHVLRKDKRFTDLTFPLGTQRRITIPNLARYIS